MNFYLYSINNYPKNNIIFQWVLSVPDSVTPCQGYDMCLDLRCGSCYDPYLGAHTSCGKLTYYDCNVNLPRECQPMRCTETNIHEVMYCISQMESN